MATDVASPAVLIRATGTPADLPGVHRRLTALSVLGRRGWARAVISHPADVRALRQLINADVPQLAAEVLRLRNQVAALQTAERGCAARCAARCAADCP